MSEQRFSIAALFLVCHITYFTHFLSSNTETSSKRGAGCATCVPWGGGGGGMGTDALEEAATDCRKNSEEEDGKEENRRERLRKDSRRCGAIKEYDGNKSL